MKDEFWHFNEPQNYQDKMFEKVKYLVSQDLTNLNYSLYKE